MRFIDTNIFVRFLSRDDEAKAAACEALFALLDSGEEEATTSDVVIAEVFYVLSGRAYRVPRNAIATRMRPLLNFRGLRLENKAVLLGALDVCEAFPELDFEGALTTSRVLSEGIGEIYSYDRDFDAIDGITRIEP